MYLWVRSQDKERLIKVFDIFVDNNLVRANFERYYNGCNYTELGEYATKERALEVLDEIMKFISVDIKLVNENYQRADIHIKGNILTSMNKIYVMPKE